MIRVMLVEDHTSFRQALQAVIALEKDLEVVAEAERADEVADLAAAAAPDVAVIDLDVPGGGGVDAVLDLRQRCPDVRVVVFTGLTDEVELGRAVEAGASAVAHKSLDIAGLLDIIRSVASGSNLLDPAETSRWLGAVGRSREAGWEARLLREQLSPREQEVLELLAEGCGGKDIAERLGISPDTAQTHIRNLRVKLGASSRLEAVALALRLGLVDPPAP